MTAHIEYPEIVKRLRKRILDLAITAGEGHIPSSLSVLDVIYTLYSRLINARDLFDQSLSRDYFILSKGHASLALYVVLEYFGYLSAEQLSNFCSLNSDLGGHPDRTKSQFLEASTGSLGHGLPIAVGLGLAKIRAQRSGKVYVLVGDGELNEGSNWEALLLAEHHRVSNLCIIIDYNHSGDRALKLYNLPRKMESFGFEVHQVDGHCERAVYNACSGAGGASAKVVIAATIKGKGVPWMENNHEWHHKIPSKLEIQ